VTAIKGKQIAETLVQTLTANETYIDFIIKDDVFLFVVFNDYIKQEAKLSLG